MIIAVERSKFNTIYKYNQASIGLGSVLDFDVKELESRAHSQNRFDILVKDFDRILPVFELDHEVLLLEVNKMAIGLSNELVVYFNSILNVYPLTSNGEKLLWGKLSDNIKVCSPIFDKVIKQVKANRAIRLRVASAKKLLDIFALNRPANPKFKQALHSALEAYIYYGKVENNMLSHLITYDKTPNYLPAGNAEFITKVGVITLRSLDKDETIIKNGDLYKKCIAFKDFINKGTFIDGLQNFYKLLKDDSLKSSYDKVVDSINPKFEELDIFKISYYFLAIKSILNKSENDFVSIAHHIEKEVKNDPNTFIHVLLLVGYSFSFEELYESFHILENATLLRKQSGTYPKSSQKNYSYSNYDNDEQPYNLDNEKQHKNIEERQSKLNEDSEIENKRELIIYEHTRGAENLEANPSDKRSKNQDSKIDQNSVELTVRNFSDWINNNAPKGKLKVWKVFMQINFPIKDELITMEALVNALEKFNKDSDLFTKSGKAKFEKSSIVKGFFKLG